MALGRKNPREQVEEDNKVVEISAEMQGSLHFKDTVNLKINGNFTGNLETRGTLTIGSSAKVEANIKGDNIVIAGKIKGDITANKMLVLMPTAVLHGNVSTPKLNIVEGAIFQGRCQMSAEGQGSDQDLLDIREVSKYLEIDTSEIEALANSGKIPGKREGNTWKFERSAIDNWVSSERVGN